MMFIVTSYTQYKHSLRVNERRDSKGREKKQKQACVAQLDSALDF